MLSKKEKIIEEAKVLFRSRANGHNILRLVKLWDDLQPLIKDKGTIVKKPTTTNNRGF